MTAPPIEALDETALRAEAQQHLQALAGPDTVLREDQWVAIAALVAQRRRALVVQRTGWGKSAVYFVATALLRARGAGPTVIVSPLLALMRNQIAAAARAGIRASTINSTNLEDWSAVYASVRAGELDVLLLSPERLNNPDFRDQVLPELARTCGLLVVDEAHCISDWGHDFRPDFRRLRTLLGELPGGIPVLATTATANTRVVEDVAEVLGLGSGGEQVLVQRGGLDRESLHLGVLRLPSDAHRLAWLGQHLDALPGSGIIYTLTVAGTQEVATYLRERGHTVAAYSGQTEQAERLAAEDDLIQNRVKALVATSALGMGFDKPDLGFVVHLGAPSSPIAYYQQIGRAGRGVERAQVILLPAYEDQAIWDYFASAGFPPQHHVETVLRALAASDRPTSTPALEPLVELSRSRLETMLKVLDVDGAVRRVRGGWIATGEPWQYDEARYARVAQVRQDEQQAMRDYLATTGCRMRFLREQLDDPATTDCGRCDNCGGLEVPTEAPEPAVSHAAAALSRPGAEFQPRRLWPAGMATMGIELSGKIAASEQAQAGRVISRFTDLGYGPRIRALFADGAPDEPVSDELVRAAVAVLKDWDWAQRPTAVVAAGSTRRPRLVASLAAQLGTIGRLPLLAGFELAGPAAGNRANSAQRLRQVHAARRLGPDAPAALAGQSVLLVDDYVDTGWTMTVLARQLRLAGAAAVYPFALGLAS